MPDNLNLNRSHDSFQFSAPAVNANLHEKFSLESSFAYSNRQQPGNVIQTSTSKENNFHLTHQKNLEQYTSPPTVIQVNQNPFAQSHSVEKFQRTLDLDNQVVDSHGYDKNQLNILHAHHCHEPVFNNPISTHCEQNRDALRENHSGYLIHPNYNQTPPHLLVQSHPCNQILDTHGSKQSETHNIQPQHNFDQVVNYPVSSNSEQNRDAFRENYSLYTNNANYNQPRPIPTVQNHPYNQITDTHVGNSYQTNNLHTQHHLDQAIYNPISSNGQQMRDPFVESNSKFFNYQNYNQAQPIPTMHSSETYASFLPGQEKIDYKFSVKLPPIKLPNYDGDPMAYHDWINMFQATVYRNHTISHTHRMTYLQKSYAAIVSGKNEDDKEFTTATSSRYGQSHSIEKNTYHQQKQVDSEIHF